MNNVCAETSAVRSAAHPAGYWPALILSLLIIIPVLPPNETFATPMLVPLGFSTAVMCLILFLCACGAWHRRVRLNADYVLIILPFAIMILIGLLHAGNQNLYLVLKDIWYILNISILMLMGYVIAANQGDIRSIFRAFVITSTIIALFHVSRLALHPDVLLLPTNELRNAMGRGYVESCIGLILIIAARRMQIRLFQSHLLTVLMAIICAASFILSFSRIQLMAFFLMVGALYGWLDLRKTRRMFFLGLLALAAILALKTLPVPKTMDNQSTFLEKLAYSLQEVRVKEYSSLADINANWRGYETARAEKAFWAGRPDQILFGQGFGQQVDLGLFMHLSAKLIHFVPILHNGYMYVLIKMGFAGLAFYVGFLLVLIFVGHQIPAGSAAAYYTGQLIVAVAIFYLLSTSVYGGLLNKFDFQELSLLLGSLLACRRHLSQGNTQHACIATRF